MQGYPQWLVQLASDPLFVIIAAIASILSFGFTLWVLIKLKRINDAMIRRTRAPSWLRQLREKRKRLSELLEDVEASRDAIAQTLVECRPTLRAMRDRSPWISDKRRRIKALLESMDRYLSPRASSRHAAGQTAVGELREIHLGLMDLTDTLREETEQARIARAEV